MRKPHIKRIQLPVWEKSAPFVWSCSDFYAWATGHTAREAYDGWAEITLTRTTLALPLVDVYNDDIATQTVTPNGNQAAFDTDV